MTGNLKLLKNFVEKFMGNVCFKNDQFVAITSYGDYVYGNIMICHVYYVEGLGHNLFSVGQICDGDLEVAFRSKTYDLGMFKLKDDIGIIIRYSEDSRGLQIYNCRTRKIMETIHVKFDELTTMASEQKEDLDNLFGQMYEEYYEKRTPKVSTNSAARDTIHNDDIPSSAAIIIAEDEAPHIVSTTTDQTPS
ncbi:hypothetical protein Tco_0819236 [Tanacetum coccineum]|uniref:Retroviral polymerase SH3-like domain-containing protein n=1 Tax=Tanacetum coccineum TaxID=301880 RepID=A0ABQ5A8J8_9ASTR